MFIKEVVMFVKSSYVQRLWLWLLPGHISSRHSSQSFLPPSAPLIPFKGPTAFLHCLIPHPQVCPHVTKTTVHSNVLLRYPLQRYPFTVMVSVKWVTGGWHNKQSCLTHRSPPGSGQNWEGCGGPEGDWTPGVMTRGASASQSAKPILSRKTHKKHVTENILPEVCWQWC